MTYQEFNKKVLDYYISRSSSSFFTLSLDCQEFENIISVDQINHFHILKSTWNLLLNIKEDIPQYFGLIAIQCYAASLMHNDGRNTAVNYKIRLRKILNLEEETTLQLLFIGLDKSAPVQEEMWHNAKFYLKNKLNLNLDIPDRKHCAGRYVQYPKSQALLNTEDLKYFTSFFAEEFQLKEILSFDYFIDRLNARFQFIEKTSRTIRLWDEEEKKCNCIKQVYDYYNLWDGQIYTPSIKKSVLINSKKKHQHTIAEKLILLFISGQPKFYIIHQDASEIKEIPKEDIFKIESYKYIYNGLLIFKEMDYYPEEYEDSRFLYSSYQNYILIDLNLKVREDRYLEKNHSSRIELSSNLILYKCFFKEDIAKSNLNQLVYLNQPAILKGGLKINRKNEYLKGYGPSVIYNRKFDIIYQNKKCEYDPESSEVGFYKIRTENFRDLEFNILSNHEKPSVTVQSKYMGWNFRTYLIEENFNLEGLRINLDSINEKSIIRQWLSANITKVKKLKYEGKNILINAVYNSKK